LEKLESGDALALQVHSGMWMRFTVQDRQIVDSRTATISTQEDKRQLIFVTCYPSHAIVPGGPLRYYMVIAETVERMADNP
jgi:LPXTG-site transpeptidase (sortase) family protein